MVLPRSCPSPTTTTCTPAAASPKRPPLKWGKSRRRTNATTAGTRTTATTFPIHHLSQIRQKLMHDVKKTIDTMKDTILRSSINEEEEDLEARELRPHTAVKAAVAAAEAMRPWNLRSRRTPAAESEAPAKFYLSLSKKEIEEDFGKMLGRGPPWKPTKRPKSVQKELDMLFPGSCLTDITADSYKVPEPLVRCSKKRRGLTTMHLSDSNAEL